MCRYSLTVKVQLVTSIKAGFRTNHNHRRGCFLKYERDGLEKPPELRNVVQDDDTHVPAGHGDLGQPRNAHKRLAVLLQNQKMSWKEAPDVIVR
jgi:hypothetical protein